MKRFYTEESIGEAEIKKVHMSDSIITKGYNVETIPKESSGGTKKHSSTRDRIPNAERKAPAPASKLGTGKAPRGKNQEKKARRSYTCEAGEDANETEEEEAEFGQTRSG
ncbi:hypothetical protein KSP40_PGU004536 [Platanthera guangdongensis]|uniref:Uncharacterized protein n=1 Tax=Platanthera guangdongensis TaxID=2320717 RepID=A0ABR2MTI1_9ASPA